jgi:DNA primase
MKDSDFNIKIVRLEEDLDPDDYILKKGKDKMLSHLSHAKSLIDYKSDIYKSKLNFSDSNDLSKYLSLVKEDLEKMNDDTARLIEIDKISKETGISKDIILGTIKVEKKEVKKPIEIKKAPVLNKYEKASEYILFHMVKNSNVIQYYFNNLSYLPNELDRNLASKIVLYYKKYKNFNLSDFISYLEDDNELIKRVMYIDELGYSENYLLDEIDTYFNTVREYIKKEEIRKLQNKMKTETNEVVKRELASKIIELKMKGEE